MALTHYDVLSVKRRASMEEVKAAFRLRSHMFHPDKYENYEEPLRSQLQTEAAKEFKRLRRAYEVLSDPEKRTAYDRDLRAKSRRSTASRTTRSRPGRRSTRPASGDNQSPRASHASGASSGNRSAQETEWERRARDPLLAVSPDYLNFGTLNPGVRRQLALRITNAGGRTLFGEITSNRAWLTVNRRSFISSSTLVLVSVDTTHLKAGEDYYGSLLVSTLNGGDRVVDVAVTIAGPPQPILSGLPEALDFGTATPGQLKSRTIRLKNTGSGRLIGSIAVTGGWLSVSESQFDDNDVAFELIANAAALVTGTHTGEVHIYSNGGAASMAVGLTVSDMDEPILSEQPAEAVHTSGSDGNGPSSQE